MRVKDFMVLSRFRSSQPVFHHWADQTKIHPPGIFALQHAHDLTHISDRFCAGFSNGFAYCFSRLFGGQLFWQELFDNANFRAFLFRQLKAPAFFVSPRAFLALLDHLAKNTEDFIIADLSFIAFATQRDIAILDGGIDQPQR